MLKTSECSQDKQVSAEVLPVLIILIGPPDRLPMALITLGDSLDLARFKGLFDPELVLREWLST